MKNLKTLITVIVPIYNAQNYLEECVCSIKKQTYTNLEIILIDDGSTDESGHMCDVYAMQDKRIKVIHQKNKGLSLARNVGLASAKGKYIAFVDSDDYIKSDMIEKLYRAIVDTESDLAIGNFIYVNNKGEKINEVESPIKNEVLTREEAINKLFEPKEWFYVVAWNKLYKRELWDSLKFPEGYIHEDEAIIHRLFYQCKKIVTTTEEFYFYRQVEGSIVHTFNAKRMDKYTAFADRIVFLASKTTQKNIKIMARRFWENYLREYYSILNDKKNYVYQKRMKKALCKVLPLFIKCGFFTRKDAVGAILFLVSPYIYKKRYMEV